MNKDLKNLIWIDLEMTGLNTFKDEIIEIATIVTDKNLNVIEEGPVIAIKTKKEIGYLFVLGACAFTLFELIGPQVMLSVLILSVIYYLIASKREAFNT